MQGVIIGDVSLLNLWQNICTQTKYKRNKIHYTMIHLSLDSNMMSGTVIEVNQTKSRRSQGLLSVFSRVGVVISPGPLISYKNKPFLLLVFLSSLNESAMSLEFISLTPEEDEYDYNCCDQEETYWIDDCECQENLATIVPLNPEECIVDEENHIQTTDLHVFFEELGYFTEEPEPIDPNRDYDAEAKALLEERDKTRKKHVDLSMPSLVDDYAHNNTPSGISSTCSSFHAHDSFTIPHPHQKVSGYTYAHHHHIHN
jgi:hypothetical protein